MADAPADYWGMLRTLREHGVEFVIIGGLAVILHGFVRMTKDIDIVPAPGRENIERLWAALVALDARPELGEFAAEEMPAEFSLEGLIEGGGNWILHTRLGRLDLMPYVEDADGELPYEELREAAVEANFEELGGDTLAFASAPHLVAMKEHAGRPQDLIDVTALRRAMGEEDD